MAMPRPGSGPNSTTARAQIDAATKSARRMRAYRRMAATSISPQTAAMTIAPRTARGSSVKNQVNRTRTMTTSTADTRPVTWLVAPAARSAAAVFDRLPATAIPLDSPAAMFDAPTPMSSRSVCTR